MEAAKEEGPIGVALAPRAIAAARAALWRAVLIAFVADFLADATIGNPTLDIAAFVLAFGVVVLRRYRQYRRDAELAHRVAVRRERLKSETIRHYQARGFDEQTMQRALARCDFDRAAVMELVLADPVPES